MQIIHPSNLINTMKRKSTKLIADFYAFIENTKHFPCWQPPNENNFRNLLPSDFTGSVSIVISATFYRGNGSRKCSWSTSTRRYVQQKIRLVRETIVVGRSSDRWNQWSFDERCGRKWASLPSLEGPPGRARVEINRRICYLTPTSPLNSPIFANYPRYRSIRGKSLSLSLSLSFCGNEIFLNERYFAKFRDEFKGLRY